ncbi:MAG: quinoprotein dehydrogenase-associated SoxYZ-like carrier [Acetobacteraceae bacterium]|nr:quinoprotein dehydrogenase-associated SoxYZ-like carrier [Acetobacteraceae bacterium]
MKSHPILGIALGLLALAGPARAAEAEDAGRAERWTELQHAVFGERALADGAGVIALEAPSRAMDAAIVPVAVTLTGAEHVKAVYLLIDGNPSPLAATVHFGPAADPRALRTRVRVEQYTLMHAVAETEDGRLFATERFVKAAGGCSAPASKDQQAAAARIGQIKLKRDPASPAAEGQPATAQLLISHPNNNGMQMDQVTRNYIPARYIQNVTVDFGGERVFAMDADISLSEDPAITFGFVPHNAGPMTVAVRDSKGSLFQQSFDFAAGRS